MPSVAVAAHELKSPLALIRQLSLLLEDESLPGGEVKAAVRRIAEVSQQSLALVQDLAQTAHLSPTLFPLEPVNPLAVCHQLAAEVAPMMHMYQREVVWPHPRRNRQLVVANHVLLRRIMSNFITNALRYSDSTMPIRISLQQRQQMLRFGVRDFGPMMSRADYRRLVSEMELRKSVRTRPGSSGLGVFVASQFARAMNGQIGLIRHRDGVTFFVDVPMSTQMSLL